MGLPDYIGEIGGREFDTRLNFRKQEQPVEKIDTPLFCVYSTGNGWLQKEFPLCQKKIVVSEDFHKSDIPLSVSDSENSSVVMQKVGSSWYIIESSKTDSMIIDGISSHQSILNPEGKCSVVTGKTSIIFSSVFRRQNTRTDDLTENSKSFKYSLVSAHGEQKFCPDPPCLIGSGELCDFRIPGDQYSAVIFNFKKRLFLRSIPNPSGQHTLADGISGENPVPLLHGTIIQSGDTRINFDLSKELRFVSQEFHFVPERKIESLCLFPMNGQNTSLFILALPTPGHSVFLGRSHTCNFTIDDQNMSRKHAQIITYDRSALLLDCHSTNGTYVNGEKIGKRMIHPGDIVSFGTINYLLCYSN